MSYQYLPYPGSSISEGSTQSANVKAIQQQLNIWGHGPLTVDGNFGPGTQGAVKEFQTVNNLTADGVVGSSTWFALFPATFTSLVNVPANVTKGVDISHYNQPVDWASIVAAGVTFVYIKTSDGIGTPDPMANQHATDAKANNLKIGYYHFCRPETRGGTAAQAGTAEAQYTLSQLSLLPNADMPLMLDLEVASSLSPGDYLSWVHSYIAALPTGTSVIIYTYTSYINSHLPPNHDLGKYPLWLARYSNDGNNAICPVGWTDWTIWQFEGCGILGNNIPIDLDIMKGSALA